MAANIGLWQLMTDPSELLGHIMLPNQSKYLSVAERVTYGEQALALTAKYAGRDFHVLSDGAKLEATYFAGRDGSTGAALPVSAKTMVLFNGRNQVPSTRGYLIGLYQQRGFNVITFNYRGIGLSEGAISSIDDLIDDGLAVVDAAKVTLGLPNHHIILHGKSLGGGPAAVAAYARPGVAIISDRSYAKLSAVASHLAQQRAPGSSIKRSFVSMFTPLVMSANNWDLDVTDYWEGIKGRKCIVYQPDDDVVPVEYSLFNAMAGDAKTAFVVLKAREAVRGHHQTIQAAEIDAVIEKLALTTLTSAAEAGAGSGGGGAHSHALSGLKASVEGGVEAFSRGATVAGSAVASGIATAALAGSGTLTKAAAGVAGTASSAASGAQLISRATESTLVKAGEGLKTTAAAAAPATLEGALAAAKALSDGVRGAAPLSEKADTHQPGKKTPKTH